MFGSLAKESTGIAPEQHAIGAVERRALGD
jgi:hypothetical protein